MSNANEAVMTTHFGENLSDYVQRVMREKKLSRSDVARNSGSEIAGSYVGRIIAGTVTNLSVEKIIALARGLEVDPYEIFAASVGKPLQEAKARLAMDLPAFGAMVQKLATSSDLLGILQLCLNMSDKDRSALLTTLKYADKSRQKARKKKRG